MSYSGKVVIITGSSAGIGQAAAYLFAKEGASVTIHGRSQDKLDKTIQLIEKHGGSKSKVLSVIGEITDEKVQKELIDKTVKKFGRIDVLVNNAGIMKKVGADSRSMDNFHYTMDVNLAAPVALTELAVPHLAKTKGNVINVSSAIAHQSMPIAPFYAVSKAALDHFARNYACLLAPPHLAKTKGNVINVSSIGGQMSTPMAPFYGIAKAALNHFARNYACILAPQGIRVNNLAPGATDSDFVTRHGIPVEAFEQMKAAFSKGVPLGRMATSEEIAGYLLFIGRAEYMTGQITTVDGGELIKYNVSKEASEGLK